MDNYLKSATIQVPCTCGELVQGMLDGSHFLISCPIDRYSSVTVQLGEKDEPGQPQPMTKARRAVEATLDLLGHAGTPFEVEVSCPLPPSKGFGSSTADVAGAIVATSIALGARLTPSEVARLAVSIEPSDGTMFPGLALFDHRGAGRWEELGEAPPLLVAVLEYEGTVDTLDYNARLDLDYLQSKEADYAHAVEMLRQGLRQGRPDLIGRAATLSATMNQQLLPKPDLETVTALAGDFHALGVCVAHSGTVMGVIFQDSELQEAMRLLREAQDGLSGLRKGWVSKMVGGGARAVPSAAFAGDPKP